MASLENLRVLVVDDNRNMRTIVSALLKGLGVVHVRAAQDGGQALKVLADWAADVAIVDFRMDPMDGVTFTQTVRRDPDNINPFLPVIMLTGYSAKGRVLEARDAGVTEMMSKPVTAKALVARLNAVIMNPRPFIRTRTYFGPDRRRRRDPEYRGPERRNKGELALDWRESPTPEQS
jgi:two-component system chemotaxis response regulator CheY